jgi:hypothetical protein
VENTGEKRDCGMNSEYIKIAYEYNQHDFEQSMGEEVPCIFIVKNVRNLIH